MASRFFPVLRTGLAAGLLVPAAGAQQLGTVQTFSFTTELEANDNIGLNEDETSALLWNNTARYGLTSRTAVNEFDLNATGTVRVQDREDESGTDTDTDDATAGLRFARSVDDTSIGLRLNYRRNELNFFNPVVDPDDDGTFDLTAEEGIRESFRAGIDFDLNTDGPLSFTGGATYDLVTFSDVVTTDEPDDDEFEDRERGAVFGEFGFRLSPVLTLTAGASYEEELFEEDDDDRQQVRADVGANAQINPRLRARARLGYSQIDVNRDDGEDTVEGAVGSLVFFVDEPRGELSFGTNVSLDENGQRVTVFVGRSLETDSTELDGNIGLSTNEDTDVNVVGDINYAYALRRAQIDLGFRQTAGVDNDGDNVLNSIGIANYSLNLTRTQSVAFGASAAVRRNLDTDEEDRERFNLTASYSQAITPDWSWNVGYTARFEQRDDEDLRQGNSVFAGITRTFASTR